MIYFGTRQDFNLTNKDDWYQVNQLSIFISGKIIVVGRKDSQEQNEMWDEDHYVAIPREH